MRTNVQNAKLRLQTWFELFFNSQRGLISFISANLQDVVEYLVASQADGIEEEYNNFKNSLGQPPRGSWYQSNIFKQNCTSLNLKESIWISFFVDGVPIAGRSKELLYIQLHNAGMRRMKKAKNQIPVLFWYDHKTKIDANRFLTAFVLQVRQWQSKKFGIQIFAGLFS